MEVRTYYAGTVEAAFALARREFGSEAMLIESKRTPLGKDPRGEYEVVFAGEPLAEPAPEGDPELGQTVWPAHVWKSPTSEIPGLVRPARVTAAEIKFGPVDLVRARPVPVPHANPVPDRKRIDDPTRKARTAASIRPAARRTLKIACSPGLARFESPSYTVALAGPAGSGKTTTAMKLAVRYGLIASHPCRLIAYDPERVGTIERLRHFSKLLKISFEAVETPSQLAAAIKVQPPGLTIIDSPGCGRADDNVLAGLAFVLGAHRDVETQLVLRADRRIADNISAAARLSALAPKRLIVTALDETGDYSELEALAVAAALPVSFLGTGQTIPDDLEPASIERLEGLINRGWSRAASAAA